MHVELDVKVRCPARPRLMEQQGVSVPDDDATLRLRQNLFNLINLGDNVEADGATVLEQAVLWLDGLLKCRPWQRRRL